jgi:hypothetical protein
MLADDLMCRKIADMDLVFILGRMAGFSEGNLMKINSWERWNMPEMAPLIVNRTQLLVHQD